MRSDLTGSTSPIEAWQQGDVTGISCVCSIWDGYAVR
ncbi:hypothetical protein PDIG_05550 [Penicillium digitatum PHI26]|uniref:Uncharacterized protein n=2 Tax=Penicillium digitatum TaxID=36651 RepID=K9GWR8_PEND2|nr:hypothetical protein PDIP_10220 [Penicillium digitatum Pd1]EKV19058.1 hypothetical protein PDIG_05550 [Penicillium digitatum PHI26]EKV21068.1 hypothetical protein PDIP_10220 [Penicillium digitatum Pd1]